MKKVYFVQNKDDEAVFFEFLKSLEDDISPYIPSFSNKKWRYTKTNFTDMLLENCQDGYIYLRKGSDADIILYEDDFQMKIVMPNQTDYHWMFGYVILYADKTDKTPESAAFRKIKKFIKEKYVLSTDRMYYIGSGIYDDWLHYKIDTQLMFSYQSIRMDNSIFDFSEFRKYIEACGYTVKGNGLDIRRTYDESNVDGYVIFSDNCLLNTITVARKIYYKPNSQCVFLNLWHGKQIEFIFDNRLLSGSCEEIVRLKNFILEFLSTLKI